ncbi:MAG: DUF2461 family protein [Candidatus Marinimicrobia bacterium]|nr:DUF2461 family protein [Candidatus Neomarinimicrobiota bacterium]
MAAIFTSKSYKFLEELRHNNTRIWFNANMDRTIEDVRDRLSAFIIAMQEPMPVWPAQPDRPFTVWVWYHKDGKSYVTGRGDRISPFHGSGKSGSRNSGGAIL